MQPIIVAGPTTSGKTTLGIQLAKRFGGVVISADSRMVYRRLDIGTGKPTWEYRELDHSPWLNHRTSEFGPVYSIQGIDHYGLDLVDPETPFTLTDWLAFARPLIEALRANNIRPVVVGGTGLYLRGLVEGLVPPPTDFDVRTAIEQRTTDEIITELAAIDPITATRERTNRRRLVRALEVVRLTGRPMSEQRRSAPLKAITIAPLVERVMLMGNIDQRLRERFDAGLIDEVRSLIDAGVSPIWQHSLGLEYRFITAWLESGSVDRTGLETSLANAIHQYAKRQLTYFRHQLPVSYTKNLTEATRFIEQSDNNA